MWVAIAVSLALSVISYALSPKPPSPKDAVAGKLDIPHPPIGEPIPVIFGKVWVKDAGVIYYGNPKQVAIKSDGGKK
jgi:hypothetical protein